jgi:hypothetical protein
VSQLNNAAALKVRPFGSKETRPSCVSFEKKAEKEKLCADIV